MSYACDVCNRIFNYLSILKMHYRTHTGEKPFQCELCSESFSHEAHLIVHKRTHRQKEEHVCELCNKTFLQKLALEVHLESHKDETKSKEFVAKNFCNENGLDRQNATPKLYRCVICEEMFTKECDLNSHSLCHKDEKPLTKNKRCDETVLMESNLSVSSRTRSKQRSFMYNVCDETFSEEENFKTHKSGCNIRGKKFSGKDILNLHPRVPTKEKPFECDVCGKLFSRMDKLNLHSRIHTNKKPYKCDACGKLFSRKDNLNIHRRVHTNEKPYECDACGQSFSRKDKLNLHYRVHTGEKPFMCSTCGKLFSRKDKLKKHLRLHVKTEPLCVIDAVKRLH